MDQELCRRARFLSTFFKKVNIGEKTLIRRYRRLGVFLTHRLVNRLFNLFLMPLLIDLLRTLAISPWGRVGEVPAPHLVILFM